VQHPNLRYMTGGSCPSCEAAVLIKSKARLCESGVPVNKIWWEPRRGDQSLKAGGALDSASKRKTLNPQTEMSPAAGPLTETNMVFQGSRKLALGLAKTAASQLDDFARSQPWLLSEAK
jgi:hypothetical protein